MDERPDGVALNIILGSSTHGEQMRQARGSRRARTELLRAWTRTEATWRLERPVIAQGPRGMSTQGGGCGVARKASESILRPIYSCPYQHHLVPRPHSPSPGPSCPVGWATGIKSGFHLATEGVGQSCSPRPHPQIPALIPLCRRSALHGGPVPGRQIHASHPKSILEESRSQDLDMFANYLQV